MGQRSQIFVRYEKNDKKYLIARYYQWNYGERMISRIRYGIEWLKEMWKYPWEVERKLYRILDTNFDMVDCQISSDIIKEYDDDLSDWSLNDYLFKYQDNNDGKCFINIMPNGTIKYIFLDYKNEKYMDAKEYMKWDGKDNWDTPTEYMSQEDIDICKKNIKQIEKMAIKMTDDEVKEFMEFDYSYLLQNIPFY